MRYLLYLILCCFLLNSEKGVAQKDEIPPTSVSLQNLQEFKPVTNNWQLVGDVFFDPIKGGKAKTTSGTNVLVNTPGKGKNGHLFTNMEHGDLDLELDFMMAKGSNAGVYLQGRYEVQMFDSWGEQDPKFSDAGAIYQRWDPKRGTGREGYEGHPPIVNVSKAPGLWQHVRIVFRAPRFNAQGQKIENARFVEVYQNGTLVQKNIEVTGPTRAAAFEDEKPLGPLMIQGDHGPIAIRNIKYKAYGTEQVNLKSLRLSSYNERFNSLPDFKSLTPSSEMNIETLGHLAPAPREGYAGQITGTIQVPTSGKYLFNLNLGWISTEINPANPNGAELTIAGKKIVSIDDIKGGKVTGLVDLEKGDHPLILSYYKTNTTWNNSINLTVEGPGVPPTSFYSPPLRSFNTPGAIMVKAGKKPVMQRGFLNHQGQKKTHIMSVGEPEYANYAVDLNSGEFLQVWRGNFIEATPMWAGRGETQLSLPLGSVIEFPAKPSLTFLANKDAIWPDSNAAYTYLGYDVNKGGRPVFKYTLGAASVRESFEPENGGKKLFHSLTVIPGQETKEIWCRVAEGTDITKLPNGLYAINDKQYFIELSGKGKPIIRTTSQNTKEMLLPIKAKNNVGMIKYAIVW